MLPERFLLRMESILGDAYPPFLQSLEKEAVRALRVNYCKTNKKTVMSAFGDSLEPITYADDGFIFSIDKIGNHPLHHAGAFYVQDPGAMATLHALPIEKGWRVADFCAAPGGKSSQLSAYIGEDGFLLSNEINHGRCKTLASNLERLGCRNVLLTNTDSENLSKWFQNYFDLVLVDAPCSGEGMFRKYDHAQTEWSEENVLACADRQKLILDHAAETVSDGGYLLYSTCTFSPEENEMNVDSFLSRHPEFSVCEVASLLKEATEDGYLFEGAEYVAALRLTRRFYPHFSLGEGQYIALLQKNKEGRIPKICYRDSAEPLTKEEKRLLEKFLEDVLEPKVARTLLNSHKVFKHKENLYIRPSDIPLPPHGVYMAGIAIGTVVKGRIEPHHQFFSAMGDFFQRKIELSCDDAFVKQYLRGETIPSVLCDGYAVVTVDGCALGGVKVSKGIAKNHYPKGLRVH